MLMGVSSLERSPYPENLFRSNQRMSRNAQNTHIYSSVCNCIMYIQCMLSCHGRGYESQGLVVIAV